MIRFLNAYFPARTVFLGISEVLLETLAFVGAMLLYLGPLNTRLALNRAGGWSRLGLVIGVIGFCMYFFDLYDSTVLRSRRETFTRLIQVLGAVCLVLGIIYSVFPSAGIQHSILFTGATTSTLMLFVWRRLFLFVNSRPAFREHVLMLGDGTLAQAVLEELRQRPELGLNVTCQLTEEQDWAGTEGFRGAGFVQELQRIVSTQHVERIVVVMGDRRGRLPVDALLDLKKRGIEVQDGTELYEVITGKIELNSLRPSTLLFSRGFQVSRRLMLFKRFCSLVLSAVLLVLALPAMAAIAVAVAFDSAGPVIFRQRRIGKDGKSFILYKFRSMRDGMAINEQSRPAEQDDKRFTRVGRWLRSTRLDELPQLWNILRGDMQFVGPRPFLPDQEGSCARNIPFYTHRWAVKPGATGWAQVNRGYCSTLEDNAEKLAYDLFYIKNMSIGLDLLVIFKTAKILLLGRGAR